jgi:hypothetical protein
MRYIVACLLPFAVCATALGDDKPDKKTEELKWAKGIADDFLNAGTRHDADQAVLLLSAEFVKSIAQQRTTPDSYLHTRFSDVTGAKSSITSEEMAPDKDEGSFRGTFTAENGEASFSIRVAKEKESGKWRVSYFVIGDRKKKDDTSKK